MAIDKNPSLAERMKVESAMDCCGVLNRIMKTKETATRAVGCYESKGAAVTRTS